MHIGNVIFVYYISTLGLFKKYSDSALLEGLLRQDNKILEYLYEVYFEMVRDHIKKNSGTEEDVYDVLQESIVILFKQVRENKYNLTSDLKGYFFGIARNIWSAQLRKKSRNTEIESDYPDEDENESGNPLLERIVSRAFKLLSDDSQTILTLFSEGYSYQEIASMMNLKNETYARRKKYLSKESLMEFVKLDPEYKDYLSLR